MICKKALVFICFLAIASCLGEPKNSPADLTAESTYGLGYYSSPHIGYGGYGYGGLGYYGGYNKLYYPSYYSHGTYSNYYGGYPSYGYGYSYPSYYSHYYG